jgi:hypothetical protein
MFEVYQEQKDKLETEQFAVSTVGVIKMILCCSYRLSLSFQSENL